MTEFQVAFLSSFILLSTVDLKLTYSQSIVFSYHVLSTPSIMAQIPLIKGLQWIATTKF